MTTPVGECPICEKTVGEWRPLRRQVGADEWRDERRCICPGCKSLERMRAIWLFFAHKGLLTDTTRMFHVAPSPGLFKRLRAMLGKRYVTLDLDRAGVDIKASLTDTGLPDNDFDLIYCSNVLEHIPDDRKAMSELFRVLRPGGLAIVQVPLGREPTQEDPSIDTPELRAKHYGQADHLRRYGPDVADRLAEAGFEVERVFMPDVLGLDPTEIERYNIAKREPVFLCRKPA